MIPSFHGFLLVLVIKHLDLTTITHFTYHPFVEHWQIMEENTASVQKVMKCQVTLAYSSHLTTTLDCM